MKTKLILLLSCLAVTAQGAGGTVPAVSSNTLSFKSSFGQQFYSAIDVVGTNSIHFESDSGWVRFKRAWAGGGQHHIWSLRPEASPNHILYIGDQRESDGIVTPLSAISLQITGSTDGNTDPRFAVMFTQGGGEEFGYRFREKSLEVHGGIGGHVWDMSDGLALTFSTNTLETRIAGSRITANSNFVAAAALVTSPASVTLTADNQTVSTTNRSYIRLSSDNATAANRTFVLTPSNISGAILTLEWTHATNQGELADDSANTGGGNNRLSAIWTLGATGQNDTLSLRFNGTDWVETGRSAN